MSHIKDIYNYRESVTAHKKNQYVYLIIIFNIYLLINKYQRQLKNNIIEFKLIELYLCRFIKNCLIKIT